MQECGVVVKMKKITLTILISILLIGTVIAGVLIKEIITDEKKQPIAIELGIDNFGYEDEDCSSGGTRRILISKSLYNLGNREDFPCMNPKDLYDWMDAFFKGGEEYNGDKDWKGILQIELDRKTTRENQEVYTKVGEGDVVIVK